MLKKLCRKTMKAWYFLSNSLYSCKDLRFHQFSLEFVRNVASSTGLKKKTQTHTTFAVASILCIWACHLMVQVLCLGAGFQCCWFGQDLKNCFRTVKLEQMYFVPVTYRDNDWFSVCELGKMEGSIGFLLFLMMWHKTLIICKDLYLFFCTSWWSFKIFGIFSLFF